MVVHGGTLGATVVFYRSALRDMVVDLREAAGDLWGRGGRGLAEVLAARPDARLFGLIVLGSVPTAFIGLVFKEPLEAAFASPRLVGGMLLVTATLLVATRFLPGAGRVHAGQMAAWQALIIGAVQGMAIIPGISRSGSTIACALLLGLDRELAARYSFLLSIPAIVGAVGLQALDADIAAVEPVPLAAGFLSAAVVGLLALAVLIPLVRRGRLHYFALYLVPVGALVLLSI